jgi:hypothetical protein
MARFSTNQRPLVKLLLLLVFILFNLQYIDAARILQGRLQAPAILTPDFEACSFWYQGLGCRREVLICI